MVNTPAPVEIRASIHQDAIHKVSRFFNATTTGCLHEILQNSRRSGATRVDITLKDGTVNVTDDGQGVQHPEALLAFGFSQWDEHTARNEDPAGMGVYALARKDRVTITSRTRHQPQAWQVHLDEAHFTGAKAAPLTFLNTPMDAGTTVSFRDDYAKPDDAKGAARYYPLPVTLNGENLEQTDFLRNCVRIEQWQGLRIGVSTDKSRQLFHHNLNFHGITLADRSIQNLTAGGWTWTALVDVVDCPQLEPTLPTRKELVQNDFLKELSNACRAAIYRAILEWPQHIDVPRDMQEDAARMGIALPSAKPILTLWAPETADAENPSDCEYYAIKKTINDDTLIMDAGLDPADQQTLHRALNRSTGTTNIYAPDGRMHGYPWYDRIPVITKASITCVTRDGETLDIRDLRTQQKQVTDHRPKAITFHLEIHSTQDGASSMTVPADIAFIAEDFWWTPENDTPLITQDSNINPDELTDLMMQSLFHASDNIDDSYNTQKDDAWNYLRTLAIATIVSKEESVKSALAKATANHLLDQVPKGWQATINIAPNHRVTVDILPATS